MLVHLSCHHVIDRWRGGVTGKTFGLAISRSQVQIRLEATLRKNLRQVVYTYVPLSPSSITWYRPKGGDLCGWGGNARYRVWEAFTSFYHVVDISVRLTEIPNNKV